VVVPAPLDVASPAWLMGIRSLDESRNERLCATYYLTICRSKSKLEKRPLYVLMRRTESRQRLHSDSDAVHQPTELFSLSKLILLFLSTEEYMYIKGLSQLMDDDDTTIWPYYSRDDEFLASRCGLLPPYRRHSKVDRCGTKQKQRLCSSQNTLILYGSCCA
jgi:hypothetical protein